MYNFFKHLTGFLSSVENWNAADVPSVPQNLMERAESEAWRNPFEAAELRDAARAYLSVVR